jgi:DUF4097 and DUF4098 domain-containing protein YvlB
MRSVISLTLLVCCAAAMSARQEVSRDFQKTVPLAGGRALKVEHSQGNIVVHTHPSGEVEIHTSIKCSADRVEDARQLCDEIKILVEENSSSVWVRTRFPDREFFHGLRNFSWAVNYDIVMPETAPLELRTQFGSVSVTDLHAPANIVTNNGRTTFTGGRGRQRIENSFGDVEVTRNDGDVTIVNANGKVTARDITGALDVRDNFGEVNITGVSKRLEVNSGNGNVTATNVDGPVTITDTFGKVTVRNCKADLIVRHQNGEVEASAITGTADLRTSFGGVRFSQIGKGVTVHGESSAITGDTVGGPATVDTTFGNIDLRGIKGAARLTGQSAGIRVSGVGGEVYAKTSFGGVTVEDAAGPITVENQSGSITARSRPAGKCQPVTLTTSFGPIKAAVAPGVGYDVTAHVTFGRISAQPSITVSGPIGGDSLSGKIGPGGCELKLNNQSGNIDIVN